MRHSSRTPTCFLRPVSHRARKQRSTQPYEPYVEASHRKEDHREQASKSTLGERWPSVHWLQSRHACEGGNGQTEGEERGAHAQVAKARASPRVRCSVRYSTVSKNVLPCGILPADETPFSNVYPLNYPLTLVTLSINPVCLTRASLYQPGLFTYTQELLQTPGSKTMAAVDSFIYRISCALCGFNQYRGTIDDRATLYRASGGNPVTLAVGDRVGDGTVKSNASFHIVRLQGSVCADARCVPMLRSIVQMRAPLMSPRVSHSHECSRVPRTHT